MAREVELSKHFKLNNFLYLPFTSQNKRQLKILTRERTFTLCLSRLLLLKRLNERTIWNSRKTIKTKN